MGKMEKKRKKITQLKQPKYQIPKKENMGWTKHLSKTSFWHAYYLGKFIR